MTTPNKERGPVGLKALSLAEGATEAINPNDVIDTSILHGIIPRQLKLAPFAEPILALEIIDGPYAGVIFSFSSFSMMPEKLENGFLPARFETTVHRAPAGFKVDEGYDLYCRDVLLAWLHFIAMSDLNGLVQTEAHKGLQ